MPSTTLSNLALESNWPLGESGWDIGMNANLSRLDALVSPYMISAVTDIPGAPATGDRYVIPAAATGVWAGQDDNIARYNGITWDIFPVLKDWIVFVADETKYKHFNGSAWVDLPGSTGLTYPLSNISELVHIATGIDIDPGNGNIQVRTLAADETLTFTNISAGQYVDLTIIKGAFVVTLSNIVEWLDDGTAPSSIATRHRVIVHNIDGTIVGSNLGGQS